MCTIQLHVYTLQLLTITGAPSLLLEAFFMVLASDLLAPHILHY